MISFVTDDLVLQNVVLAGLISPSILLVDTTMPAFAILIASLLLMIKTSFFDDFSQVTAKVEQKKEVNKLDAWLFKQNAIHLK